MYDKKQICAAIITRISVLTHCNLTPDEQNDARQGMTDTLNAADRAGIPWKLQNQLLYVGEKYDVRGWYISDLLQIASKRANIQIV